MVRERVERRLGGGDHLDPEALEQRAGAEGGGGERLADPVEVEVGGLGFEGDVEPERFGEYPIELQPRRRAAEQMVMRRRGPPRLTRFGDWRPVIEGDPQRFERNALAVEHPQDIMVGAEQQVSRVRERRVGRESCGIGMAVRADDRQASDAVVKAPSDRADIRVGRQQAIGMEYERLYHGNNPAGIAA